jgi:hypothetical protein
MEQFVNKVAESGIVTLNLESYMPKQELVSFDLKDYLFMGLILKEKDFRESLQNIDYSVYENKIVCVHCSADAIVPLWAYMLVAKHLADFAYQVHQGNTEAVLEKLWVKNIESLDATSFVDARIVVKGCGDVSIPANAYLSITTKLLPVAKSIMYGEPCSTVPIYKKKKIAAE